MLRDLLYRIQVLLWRGRAEDALDDELRFHVEKQIEKHVRSGMTPDEAARRARVELGGLAQVKEDTRQSWGIIGATSVARDVGFALRSLRRSPVLMVTVVLTLALGIGASTAIFTLLEAVLWRMLPVRSPETLLSVGGQVRSSADPVSGFEYSTYEALRDGSRLVDVAGYTTAPINVRIDGPPEPTVQGQLVTGGYFSLLGVVPAIGRAIGPEDDRTPNGHPVVMLGYGYWQRRFDRDPDVIGRTIRLSGLPFTVIGVAPQGFFGAELGTAADLFLPIMMQPTVMPAFENLLEAPIVRRPWVRILARVREGSTAEQASAQMTELFRVALTERREGRGTIDLRETRVVLRPATELSELRRQAAGPLGLLLGFAGILLLIACANVANLLLARAATRRPEFAMRLALGAGRGRLIQQLLVEGTLLAGLGGLGGILLAGWVTRLLVVYISTGRTPVMLDLDPNVRVLAFTVAASVLTGILFGLVPALRASRIDLTPVLKKASGVSAGGQTGLRPGRALAVAQIVLSLLLLVGASLFMRSLQRLAGEGAGVARDRVLVMRVEPRGSDQRNIPGTSGRLDRTYRQLIERVEQLPGVRSASMSNSTPVEPVSSAGIPLDTASGQRIGVPVLMAYPGYFATVGMPMATGRDFDTADLNDGAPLVCVVNEAFVREALPDRNPIGEPCFTQQRQLDSPDRTVEEAFRIVGVVQDSRYTNPRGPARPLIYVPFLQAPTGRGQMVLHVRTSPGGTDLRSAIRSAVSTVDPSMPIFAIHTLDEEMDAALVQQRMLALLSGVFGAVALLLACVGLYGLLAFGVVQRSGEMGIRLALGAGSGRLVWLVMRDALIVVGTGVAIGLALAVITALAARWLVPGLLFGVSAQDVITSGVVTLLLFVVALLAACVPAGRAARLDPLVALRVP